MQLPIGIMLDKFNFRIVIFFSIILTSFGTITLTISTNYPYLLLSRLMIKAGSAVGFLSITKIITLYFPLKYHSLMIGFSFTFGLVGAVFCLTPMKILFAKFGHQNTFYSLSLIWLVIASTILLTKDNNYVKTSEQNIPTSKLYIFKLLFSPIILLIGISGGLMVEALECFADLWAIPFFKQIDKMSDIESNVITSFVYIGMCFGGPVLAITTNIVKYPNLIIVITGLMMIVIFLISLYFPVISFYPSCLLMFFLGISCCYQVLIFSSVSSLVNNKHVGFTIAIINCINMSFGHFFHKLISNVITYSWDETYNKEGIAIYSRYDFTMAIFAIPICCLIGILLFLYLFSKMNPGCKNEEQKKLSYSKAIKKNIEEEN